jgi:hypothetical protein
MLMIENGVGPVMLAMAFWNTFYHLVQFLAWLCQQVHPTPFAALLRLVPLRSAVFALSTTAALGDPAAPYAALAQCLRALLIHVLVHYTQATAPSHAVLVLWLVAFANFTVSERMVDFPESELYASGVFVLGATFNLVAICVALPDLVLSDIGWAVVSGTGFVVSAVQPPSLRLRAAGTAFYSLGTVYLCNRMRLFASAAQP